MTTYEAETAAFKATNLDALLAILTGETGALVGDQAMTKLPTFGGEEPANTIGVWSWDETRLLVTHKAMGELRIVSREAQ